MGYYGVQPPANNGAMDVEDDLTIVVRFVATAAPKTGPQVSLDDRHPKLDTPLATLARIARDRGTDEALKTARGMNLEVADGRVRVVVARGPRQQTSVRALVEAAGGEVYTRGERDWGVGAAFRDGGARRPARGRGHECPAP